jgi:hypothetical protein
VPVPQRMSVPPPSGSDADETVPAEHWQARALQAQRGGDFLATYDAAMRGIAAHPESVTLRQRAILALASTGATARARAMLRELGLEGREPDEIVALEARLAKEHALSVRGAERARHALTAATLYECIHARTSGIHSGINAAAMRLFAGDPDRATMLARQVLDTCTRERPASPEEAYYVAATEAEASLLLGDADKASAKLRMVRLLSNDDHSARAALRRYLRRICEEKGIAPEVLDLLKPPSVIHYTGHRIAPDGSSGSFAPESEDHVAQQVASYLASKKVGFGYGSLACGADIIFAEALLKRGAELHVVLPAAESEFSRVAVAPAGPAWMKRFRKCLDAANSVTLAGTDADECTDLLFDYGSRIAMGLALLRARALDADLEQAVIWDRTDEGGATGPAVEVSAWRARGMPTHVIDPGPPASGGPSSFVVRPAGQNRTLCAMLFGEVTGISRLREPDVPVFVREVMGAFGRVLDKFGESVLLRHTWGDGFYVVLTGAAVAARCALALQKSMLSLNPISLGLPKDLALRLGAHTGPVYQGYDPVMKGPAFYGTHVTRTVRIEPMMPEGEVFVTEPFAAALTLEDASFACEYVGQMPAVKGYSSMRMYVLKKPEGEASAT